MGAPSATEFARRLSALIETEETCVVATVVEIVGSASARPGAKAIVDRAGRVVFGWVGGGCAESTVRDEALRALAERRPRTIRLDLDDEVLGVGMPCGGHMTVFIEPYLPEPRLLVLGHGRIAETVAAMGKLLEFHVTVNDPLATAAAFPRADVRITDDPDYAKAECDGETCVVITTQHRSDYEALEDGFPREMLGSVFAPTGLDIGAETPQEIALSIVAEIVQRRRGPQTTGRSLVETKGVRITDQGVETPEGPLEPEKCPR
jgi:xanthine dehydrogenase accessory factor